MFAGIQKQLKIVREMAVVRNNERALAHIALPLMCMVKLACVFLMRLHGPTLSNSILYRALCPGDIFSCDVRCFETAETVTSYRLPYNEREKDWLISGSTD